MRNEGYEAIGIKPIGNQIMLELNNDDLIVLGSPYAKNVPESDIKKDTGRKGIIDKGGKPIFKGTEIEKQEKEEARKNRTFTIACLSDALCSRESELQVGNEVSLKDCRMAEIQIGDKVYAVVDKLYVLTVHKDKINPGV